MSVEEEGKTPEGAENRHPKKLRAEKKNYIWGER